MIQYQSFSGTIVSISDFPITANGADDGCYKMVAVIDGTGRQVNFIVEPKTYFLDREMVRVGDRVTGYHDANAPVPMIYPPQYRALIMVKERTDRNVKVDFFNSQLISSDGMLKLNLSTGTQIRLENGQAFTKSPANRNLLVVYGPSTFSIPAQTTPYQIIVLC
ncbi:hypothetical protein [Mesobacillus subterraneus]|uniref:Uncharacterized protein n=1 Tax=Mesobacillus subterraneus TaxID=285983 RepID=A0A3R9E988_9BACI|nr:hypothetical protein [Mesobacillus subterraneus]RSD26832.1 hypothetical protein EJA10_13340 [Mesobacillus subterraneus]